MGGGGGGDLPAAVCVMCFIQWLVILKIHVVLVHPLNFLP